MNVFSTTDYQRFLHEKIKENNEHYGYKTKLAKAANCQKSFLSLVLNSEAHLTPEHAIGTSKFWELSPKETEYFVELVSYARAGSRELKTHIKERIDRMRRDHEHLGKRFEQPSVSMTDAASLVYYSSWHYSAIHMLLTVPNFQNPKKIAQRLNMPETFINDALEQLHRLDLAKRNPDGGWEVGKKSIHMPKDSLLNAINNANWRERARTDALLKSTESIHYTGVYSLSLKDFQRLREMVFEFIDRTRDLVVPSKEEDIACFTCDLFSVS